VVYVADREAEGGEAPLPDEWVIRDLRTADLDSDSGVEAILNRFPFRWSPSWPGNSVDRRIIPGDQRRRLRSLGVGFEPFCGIEDLRWCLKGLRAAANTWTYASLSMDPLAAWADEGFRLHGTYFGIDFSPWQAFSSVLRSGLEQWSPGAFYTSTRGSDETSVGTVAEWELRLHDIFTAGCQQLFNLMVDRRVTPRRCESATCRRIFVHQLGGSRHWQRTKGVRYCSPQCAKAEAQRQYRRRQKAAAHPSGLGRTRANGPRNAFMTTANARRKLVEQTA
jgi:hypothetical protein